MCALSPIDPGVTRGLRGLYSLKNQAIYKNPFGLDVRYVPRESKDLMTSQLRLSLPLPPSPPLSPSRKGIFYVSVKNNLFLIMANKKKPSTQRRTLHNHSGSPTFPNEVKDKRIQTTTPGEELLNALSR